MPKTEINVNGVTVKTDLVVASISDSRVRFTDGSWCDVNTGMVICKGKGYIHITTSPKDLPGACIVDRVVFDSNKIQAPGIKAVEIQNVSAVLEVRPTHEDRVTVTVTGAGSAYQDIEVAQDGATLYIKDKGGTGVHIEQMVVSGRGAVGIHLGDSFNVSISESSVSSVQIGGSTSASKKRFLRITIHVPIGTRLAIHEVDGNITIGDTYGEVRLSTAGTNHTTIGRIGDLELVKSGVGDVFVESVQGNCTIKNKGVGSVTVRDGEVAMLHAKVSGTGPIQYKGTATNAKLIIKGVGGIEVTHVTNEPEIKLKGVGRIVVSNWP
ncbi:MAG: DUF2807 domain-containing protein [Patescibacteria group bacterium]|nr:DUF2807 domain-containing protein [Patescibacteria group bacterium]